MKNQIVASIAALPFAIAGVFAGAANAATFGQFQLSSGALIPGGQSTVTLNAEGLMLPELDFSPEPTPIGIAASEGIFTPFDTASIQDIISFGPPVIVDNPFIDFGTSDFGVGSVSSPSNASIADEVEIFNLKKADYQLSQSGANVAIDVMLYGDFVIGGKTYKGAGNLTFQENNITVAEVEDILAEGGSLEDMTFSGALFTASTPEPTTLFGLGVVATGLVASRRKKSS